MAASLAAIAFVLAGLPVALALGPLPVAIGLAILVSVVGAHLAAIVHLVADVPIHLAWLAIMAGGWLPFASARRRGAALGNLRRPWTTMDTALLVALAGLIALLVIDPGPPLAWDARSIWLFHAKWLIHPADVYLRTQLDPAIFPHPGYPGAGPAGVAVVWGLAGGAVDLVGGIRVIALMNIGAALVVVQSLVRAAAARSDRWNLAIGVAALVALTAIHPGSGRNNGYMDVLQGLTVAAVAVQVARSLHRMPSRLDLLTVALLGILAANVKQEGVAFLAALVVASLPFALRRRSVIPTLVAGVAPGLVVAAVWQVAISQLGQAPPEDAGGILGRLPEFLSPTSVALAAVVRTVTGYAAFFSAPFLGLAGIALLGLWRGRREVDAIMAPGLLLLAAVGVLGVMLVTYAAGNQRAALDWWLETSYARVNATLAGLALASTAFSLLASVASGPDRTGTVG